ncbi:hypothetical protein [Wenyingzhuangia aestuarii]|uniref:hypothetical protein n=1 Tax=Wenyingzhuangia aestuarii TaxID=1647582 RepID=UPI0014396391|nr:hypothetical protein [Wenyingzhuangia aestuarii]NJB83146.1 hypothetical protein [Wenyingzhuangia aestuarii]
MKRLKLKNLLVLFTLVFYSQMNSQINYNKEAWSFELDKKVKYNGGTADIITAWTQDAGFTLSSEYVHSGKYSCKMDFSKQDKSGKLQTWRSKQGKEGDIQVLSKKSYSVSAWFYIPSGTPSGKLGISLQKSGGKEVVANLNLKRVKVGEWTKVTAKFNGIPVVDKKLWSSVSYYSKPKSNITIYVDDITFQELN